MKITGFQRISKEEPEDNDKAPLWMVSFTDLVTILLAFFILLFATAQPKKESWTAASESMRTSFGGDRHSEQAGGEAGHKDADKTWASEIRDPALNMDYLYSLVKQYLRKDAELSNIDVWQTDDMVVISVDGDLNFQPGQIELSPQGRALVMKLAPLLSSLSNSLEIVGHADPTSISSDNPLYNSNWHLSLARANSVAKTLADAGYNAAIDIRGRGTVDADTVPDDLSENLRNAKARRVDLRLHMVHP